MRFSAGVRSVGLVRFGELTRSGHTATADAGSADSFTSEIEIQLFSLRSCSHTSADLRAVCSGWPALPEVASDVNTGIAGYVMGLALKAIDSAYRGAA
jgi:hypothetical protein